MEPSLIAFPSTARHLHFHPNQNPGAAGLPKILLLPNFWGAKTCQKNLMGSILKIFPQIKYLSAKSCRSASVAGSASVVSGSSSRSHLIQVLLFVMIFNISLSSFSLSHSSTIFSRSASPSMRPSTAPVLMDE